MKAIVTNPFTVSVDKDKRQFNVGEEIDVQVNPDYSVTVLVGSIPTTSYSHTATLDFKLVDSAPL